MDQAIAQLPIIAHIRCDTLPLGCNAMHVCQYFCGRVLYVYYIFMLPHAEMHVGRCRRLFAELQEGPRSSADPTEFAASLNLDRSVQQVTSMPIYGLTRGHPAHLHAWWWY